MNNPHIVLLVMTNGRQEYLLQTLRSAQKQLSYKFTAKIIVNDCTDKQYDKWLNDTYRHEFTILSCIKSAGFCGAIQRAWKSIPFHTDYVFHLEEDFILNEQINIENMIEILKNNPELAQVALLRQAWNKAEKTAGGVIHLHADDFIERRSNDLCWTEHSRFFTTNPSLYPVKITEIPYPQEEGCEGKFAAILLTMGYKFAYLGRKWQRPKVNHIGHSRHSNWKWYGREAE